MIFNIFSSSCHLVSPPLYTKGGVHFIYIYAATVAQGEQGKCGFYTLPFDGVELYIYRRTL